MIFKARLHPENMTKMKKAILLYNAKAGRGTMRRNLRKIVDIFREAEYDMHA